MNAAQPVYTISSDTSISLDDIVNWKFEETIPFENGFPDWKDFEKMCKEYPGLEQAYEKLKTFYDLCKDEWEHKKKGLE